MKRWDLLRDALKTPSQTQISDDDILPFSLRGLSGDARVVKVNAGDCVELITTVDIFSLLRPYVVDRRGEKSTIGYNAVSTDASGKLKIRLACHLSGVVVDRGSTIRGRIAKEFMLAMVEKGTRFSYQIVGQDGAYHDIVLTINGEDVNQLILAYRYMDNPIAWTPAAIKSKTHC